MTSAHAPLAGVVFDLDGTLTAPHAIDFVRMRERIGMPAAAGSVLHWIEANVTDATERARCHAVVEDEERLGLERMELGRGFERLAEHLAATRDDLRTSIVTRNARSAIDAFDALLASEGFGGVDALFCCTLARGEHSATLGRAVRNKPSPEPAHESVRARGLEHRFAPVDLGPGAPPAHPEIVFVGDSNDDLVAGRRAGFRTCLVRHGAPARAEEPPHVEVDDLAELRDWFASAARGPHHGAGLSGA